MAAPGAAKKVFQACSTAVSLNAMMSPPITSASRMASVVTTAGLPSVIALMTMWFRPWPLGARHRARLPWRDRLGGDVRAGVFGALGGVGGRPFTSSLMPVIALC